MALELIQSIILISTQTITNTMNPFTNIDESEGMMELSGEGVYRRVAPFGFKPFEDNRIKACAT